MTFKDHEEEFPEKSSFRLTNRSKSEIRKISKYILDKINKAAIEATKLSQWKNKDIVIEWFKNIENKAVIVLLYLTLKVFTLLYHQSYSTRV